MAMPIPSSKLFPSIFLPILRKDTTWFLLITSKYPTAPSLDKAPPLDQHCHNDIISSNKRITCNVRSGDLDSALRVFNNMEAAWSFFNSMPFKNIASWNTVMSGFAQNGVMGKARALFLAMLEKNSATWSAMISGYVECGELELAVEFFEVAAVKSVVTWTAMISGWGNKFISLFASRLRDDTVAGEKALYLLEEMGYEGITPDWITFLAVLLACNHAGLVDIGVQIHKNLEKAEFAAENLLNLDPKSSAGYVVLGNVYAAMNKWDHVASIRQSMKDNKVVKKPGYTVG
ncbi:hypothetical protein CRYUN_Cryun19dG0147800 [Craigia yunnanensis]